VLPLMPLFFPLFPLKHMVTNNFDKQKITIIFIRILQICLLNVTIKRYVKEPFSHMCTVYSTIVEKDISLFECSDRHHIQSALKYCTSCNIAVKVLFNKKYELEFTYT